MNKRLVTATLISLFLGLGAVAPSALAAPPVVPGQTAPTQVRSDRQPVQADRDADSKRYAAAEKAQPDAAEFEGGASIVIVGSTTAIVLGIILLIVLL
jgi:hypothetical protein